jgi:hypothetical protein
VCLCRTYGPCTICSWYHGALIHSLSHTHAVCVSLACALSFFLSGPADVRELARADTGRLRSPRGVAPPPEPELATLMSASASGAPTGTTPLQSQPPSTPSHESRWPRWRKARAVPAPVPAVTPGTARRWWGRWGLRRARSASQRGPAPDADNAAVAAFAATFLALYEMGPTVGEGGYAVVRVAHHRITREKVRGRLGAYVCVCVCVCVCLCACLCACMRIALERCTWPVTALLHEAAA